MCPSAKINLSALHSVRLQSQRGLALHPLITTASSPVLIPHASVLCDVLSIPFLKLFVFFGVVHI